MKLRETIELEREVFVNAEDKDEAKEKALQGEIFAPGSSKSRIVSREFVGFSGSTAMEAVRVTPQDRKV